MHHDEAASGSTLFATPFPPPIQRDAVQAVFEHAAELFAALSCPTRLRIVCELRHSGQTVHRLVQTVHCSQPNISGHLRLLRRAGIVRRERSGNAVTYHLTSAIADSVCDAMCTH
ncbi:MAG: ArsR/SmtB family transcription factor [Thiomonas sp.]